MPKWEVELTATVDVSLIIEGDNTAMAKVKARRMLLTHLDRLAESLAEPVFYDIKSVSVVEYEEYKT